MAFPDLQCLGPACPFYGLDGACGLRRIANGEGRTKKGDPLRKMKNHPTQDDLLDYCSNNWEPAIPYTRRDTPDDGSTKK